MTLLLSSIGPILAAPWQQRRNTASLWGVAFVVGLILLGPGVLYGIGLVAHVHGSADAARAAIQAQQSVDMFGIATNTLVCALATLILTWFAMAVANLLDQNRPVLATLVPGHPRRLRTALLVAWFGSVAVITAMFDERFGHALLCMAIAGPVFALAAASLRWPALWALFALQPFVMMWPGRDHAFEVVRETWLAQPLAIASTALAASAVLLVALIQAGGRRHVASDAARRSRQQRFQMRARGADPMVADQRGAYDRWMSRAYYAVLRRGLAHPGRAAFGRVMLGLGPGLHWTNVASSLVFSGVMVVFLWGVVLLLGPYFPILHDFGPIVLVGLSSGMVPGMVLVPLQAPARLNQTRREQALLVLLPGVPRGAALSRRLAWQLTGQFAMAWVGAALIVVAIKAVGVQPTWTTTDVKAANPHLAGWMILAALPLFVFLWRPWARLGAPAPLGNLVPMLSMAVMVASLAWAGEGNASAVAATAVGLAVAWCGWRWRRMAREPEALPLGRAA